MKKIFTKNDSDLEELYNDSALTWEGFSIDDSNLEAVENWIVKQGATLTKKTVYITSGALMNEVYKLTGDNAYPDDLNIVSIKLSDIGNYEAIIVPRFSVGARWFDDIVENNLWRERKKKGEAYDGI